MPNEILNIVGVALALAGLAAGTFLFVEALVLILAALASVADYFRPQLPSDPQPPWKITAPDARFMGYDSDDRPTPHQQARVRPRDTG